MLPGGNGDALWIEYGDAASLAESSSTAARRGRGTTRLAFARGSRRFRQATATSSCSSSRTSTPTTSTARSSCCRTPQLGVTFGDVWFNGWRHLPDTLEPLGPVEGELLTDAIVGQGLPWNEAFGGAAVVVPDRGPLLSATLADELEITVARARPAEQLVELKPVWRAAVEEAGLDPDEPRPAPVPEPPLPPGLERLGTTPDVDALAASAFKQDTAAAERVEHRRSCSSTTAATALLTGDAFPSVVLAGVEPAPGRRAAATAGGRRVQDAAPRKPLNLSPALLARLDCKRHLFSSNGSKTRHPHPEASGAPSLRPGQGRRSTSTTRPASTSLGGRRAQGTARVRRRLPGSGRSGSDGHARRRLTCRTTTRFGSASSAVTRRRTTYEFTPRARPERRPAASPFRSRRSSSRTSCSAWAARARRTRHRLTGAPAGTPIRQRSLRFPLRRPRARPLPRLVLGGPALAQGPADHARPDRHAGAHGSALGVPVRGPGFLSISTWTPVVRYLEMPRSRPPFEVDAAAARPRDGELPYGRSSWTSLSSGASSKARSRRQRRRVRSRSIGSSARRSRRSSESYGATDYHVFHYIGHGDFDAGPETACSCSRTRTARSRRVSGAQLGTMLADETTLRLAVLNACEGARDVADRPVRGRRREPRAARDPRGRRHAVRDHRPRGDRLRGGVLRGDRGRVRSRRLARRGAKAIFASGNDIEWATPVLFMRAPDGLVFQVASPAPRPGARAGARAGEAAGARAAPGPLGGAGGPGRRPWSRTCRPSRRESRSSRPRPGVPLGVAACAASAGVLQFLAVLAEWEPGPGWGLVGALLPRLGRRLPRPARTARARRRHLRRVGGPLRAAHRRLRARRARRPRRVGRRAARRRARAPGELQRLGRSDRCGRPRPRRSGIRAHGRRRRARGCAPARGGGRADARRRARQRGRPRHRAHPRGAPRPLQRRRHEGRVLRTVRHPPRPVARRGLGRVPTGRHARGCLGGGGGRGGRSPSLCSRSAGRARSRQRMPRLALHRGADRPRRRVRLGRAGGFLGLAGALLLVAAARRVGRYTSGRGVR